MVHNGRDKLHVPAALGAASIAAAEGYARDGQQGAVTGAVIGGLAGLFGGHAAIRAIQGQRTTRL